MTWYAWAQETNTFKHSTRQPTARFSTGTTVAIDIDFNTVGVTTMQAVRRIIKRRHPIPSDSSVNLQGAHIIYRMLGYDYEHSVEFPWRNPKSGISVMYQAVGNSAIDRELVTKWSEEAEPMCLLLNVELSIDSFTRFFITNRGSQNLEPISLLLKKHPFIPPEVTEKALLLLDSKPRGQIVYKSGHIGTDYHVRNSRLWHGNFYEMECKLHGE